MNARQSRSFANGSVYALETDDGYPIETTDTFLPFYTKDATGGGSNALRDGDAGSRGDRWMIGVSVMSGCPVRCKFCATGRLRRWRSLSASEIVDQIKFVLNRNTNIDPRNSREFKVNYTRMGEPFLNIHAVREAISEIESIVPGTHHYISTIGMSGSDFGWICGNVTLQVSVHSLDSSRRDWLIPYRQKLSIRELGQIRTNSILKTTVNLTLMDECDFDINALTEMLDPKHFFVKLSPINPNAVSDANAMGTGIVNGIIN